MDALENMFPFSIFGVHVTFILIYFGISFYVKLLCMALSFGFWTWALRVLTLEDYPLNRSY